MRILFMGTPDIAAECLKALYAAGHDICAVYTRRDKPVGRKQVLTAPPVKEVALAHGTPVFQPRTLRDGSEDDTIRALAPELIVVVAYGCILPKSVLETPKYGCINLHVSLLPKYRGSAPVQWAVLNGDAETGVSIMQMDEGLDTGDVLCCEKIAIDPEETSGQLFDRVTAVGARVLCEVVPAIAAGTLSAHRLHARTCLGVSLSCKNDPSVFPRQQNRRVECFAAQKRGVRVRKRHRTGVRLQKFHAAVCIQCIHPRQIQLCRRAELPLPHRCGQKRLCALQENNMLRRVQK